MFSSCLTCFLLHLDRSWNLQSRRCLERFSNEDGTITSSLSASFKNLAVGAESGVVNLYSSQGSHHQKLKSIMNMHTSADYTKFNHDGQILAFSSRREKHSMKLLHVPTATVFSNWPTSKTPLNYVWSMDFSPQIKVSGRWQRQGQLSSLQTEPLSQQRLMNNIVDSTKIITVVDSR